MGYNLYITRRKYFFDEEGPSISEEEWRGLVASDPELCFKQEDEPLTAFWDGDCQNPDPWFAYCGENGSIDTKNPDEAIINKMLQMAAALNAKVQGDDGEVYRSENDSFFEEDDEDLQTELTSKPWWKRLLGLS